MARGPEPKAPRPAWSTALRARRIQLNLRQEDVAARTEDLVSQGTISDLERGKTHLMNITAPRVVALADALEWTPQDFEKATGVPIWRSVDLMVSDGKQTFYVESKHVADVDVKARRRSDYPASAASTGYRIPRSAPRPIDSALLKAAEEYGDKTELAPLREYRWLRTLNDIPFKRRPVTPE
ncbi:helix-turn-helix domain-containing protein [Deinococcus humi]